jgi:chromosome segregation ATPase
MSGEITQDFNGNRPFEDRVFARFDGIESFLRSLDGRVQVLESRSHDTKPIWERALKEILETGLEVGEIKSKVAVIETDIAGLKTDVAGLKTDVAGLKTDVAGVKTEVTEVKNEVTGMKTELAGVKTELVDMKTEVAGMKAELAGVKTDYAGVKNELMGVKRELKHYVNQKLDLILKFLLEGRDDIRDADERIKQLESKLA